jgi:Tol biopolymer transport system component
MSNLCGPFRPGISLYEVKTSTPADILRKNMNRTKATTTLIGAVLTALLALASANNAECQSVPRIAFQAPVTLNRATSYSQIFSISPDGSGLLKLTSANSSALAPRWSPGQQYISFWRKNTLFVMEAIGEANGGRSFAVAPAGGFGSDWSPDGSSLVYRGTSSNLYIVTINVAAGTAGSPMLFREGHYYDPSWSPDGTRIAFWGSDDGNGELIKVRDVLTGAETSFGVAPTHNYAPQWSPDGNLIAFSGQVTVVVKTKRGTRTTTSNEILLANADGSSITQATYLNSFSDFPTWSPDATTLAFGSDVSGTSSIYKMVLGSNVATPVHSPGNDPDWKP